MVEKTKKNTGSEKPELGEFNLHIGNLTMHFDTKHTNVYPSSKWQSEKNPCQLSGNTADFVASGCHLSHLVRFYNFSRLPVTDLSWKWRHTSLERFHTFKKKKMLLPLWSQWQHYNHLKWAWGCVGPQRLSAKSENPEAPEPSPGCGEGRASLSGLPAWRAQESKKSRSNSAPSLRRAGFPGCCTAGRAGAFRTRPRTLTRQSRARRREREPHSRPARKPAPPLQPRISRPPALPPSSAPAQLCSAPTLQAKSREPAPSRRRRPLLSAAWVAAASALPVVGEHALVDHHDEEGAHAVKASGQQFQEHGQRFGRRHPQLLLMSVCGGFRGGFSFNPGLLTSMNFRHGGGGGGLRGERRAAGPTRAGVWGGSSWGLAGPRPVYWVGCRRRLGSPRGRRPPPPRGRDAVVHTPRDFDRALCNAGSEGRGRAWLGLGRAWRGPGEGAVATLSPGQRGRSSLGGTTRGHQDT